MGEAFNSRFFVEGENDKTNHSDTIESIQPHSSYQEESHVVSRAIMGYGKDSFLGEPFALLKSHMSFILYLRIIARQEEWELRQAYRAPVEEGARRVKKPGDATRPAYLHTLINAKRNKENGSRTPSPVFCEIISQSTSTPYPKQRV